MMIKYFKEFLIDDIFNLHSSSSGIDKNKLIKLDDRIPYITRTDKNNGIDMFIGEQIPNYCLDTGNAITVGLDTQTIFYQPHKFYTGQNIQVLELKELNILTAIYIIPLLKKQMVKFNWGGNGATLGRLKKTKILFPVNSKNEPDYEHMESYIKSLAAKKEKEYIDYIYKRIDPLKYIKEPVALKDKKWLTFTLGDLFLLVQGKSKGLNHLIKVQHDGINYLGATNQNNGVLTYVEEVSKIKR